MVSLETLLKKKIEGDGHPITRRQKKDKPSRETMATPIWFDFFLSPCSMVRQKNCSVLCVLEKSDYGTSFYRIEMLALLNDMIIVDRYLWE
jgi:hypothetical protein